MSCTPQEIEAKRKEAQQRLQEQKKRKLGDSNLNTFGRYAPYNNCSPGPRSNASSSSNKIPYTSSHFKMKSTMNHSPKNYQNSAPPKLPVEFYGKDTTVKVTLAVISVDRFSVDMSGYSQPVIDIMKTISSKFYDPKTKIWNFHIDHYDVLLNKLAALKSEVVVSKLPQFVMNVCGGKKIDENVEYDFSTIDAELFNTLMPFQVDGVCFGIDKNGRCMIADDMGLGKTFQALAIANYYKSDWPLLIVTTASMKNVWEDTIYKYIPSVPVMQIQYMEQSKDYIGSSKVLIVSHDLMSRSVEKLIEVGYGVMIVDESHTLKNYKTKSTKAATALSKRAKRVILLSGTPALSRPSELFSQLSLIDDRFFGSFFDYSRRYCDGKQSSFGWDASGQSNLKELEVILAKKFMIRRTKEDVLKSLPNKRQEVITLDVNLSQFSVEDQQTLLALAAKYNTVKKDKHAALLTFFSETAKIKIPSVCSYVLQLLETSDKKFLLFAHHLSILNALEQVLQKKKKKYIRIDGNTSTLQRKYFVDKFQMDDEYVCALLSITAANAGITLTAAQLVVFAELHWNPSIISQAEARAHRIGQDSQVTIQYLIAPGTADDSMWPLLKEKQKTLNKIGLMGETFKDVSVKIQENRSNINLPSTQNSGSITSSNTLDIRTYCSPSPKKVIEPARTAEEEFMDSDMDECLADFEF